MYGGRENADYCPVNDIYPKEEENIYFVGNCKKGNGLYGSYINYVGNEKILNRNLPSILGEI